MKLATIEKAQKKRKPPKTILLQPGHFADTWPDKPDEAVCVGIRLISQSERTRARILAEKTATDAHPRGGVNAVDAFNDALMRICIAGAMCDPNDVTRRSDMFQEAEDDVFDALTSRGCTFVYEQVERLEIESSALAHEVSEEELGDLVDAISADALQRLEPGYRALCRRLLGYVHDQLKRAGALVSQA